MPLAPRTERTGRPAKRSNQWENMSGETKPIRAGLDQAGFLVRTQTQDGLRLDGYLLPCPGPEKGLPVIVCIHGAASNFYAGGFWDELVPVLHRSGYHVLRVNTRGHDGHFTAKTATGTVRLGAAYERVADCTRDIAAWADWCQRNGHQSLVLLGHSLGAIKALYSQAYQPCGVIRGVVALSPPRLSCLVYLEKVPRFRALLENAQRLCQSGQGQALFESTFPFPMLITAEAFLDKYGDERYNIVTFLDRITVPACFIYGEHELVDDWSFSGLPEQIMAGGQENRRRVSVLPGADHFYTGRYEAVSSLVVEYLRWVAEQP